MAARARLADVAKLMLGLWMAGVIIAMFLVVPQYIGLGDAGRIIIVHVPTAWITTVAFIVSAIYSIRYLRNRQLSDDAHAVASAEVGFLFCALATITGSIFAEVVWGVFWNWDPRETSILVLLLIYAAYFALRSALDDPDRRRRLAAVYNLFAAVAMPFLLFVAPRVADSTLHPNCAFLPGSKCEGVTLQVNGTRIGQLGDLVIELQGIEQRGTLAVGTVQVRMPGLREVAVLTPSYDLSTGSMADRPQFPGQQFMLSMKNVDLANGSALLNIEAPGTGLLGNQRTMWTFMAANIAFLGLCIWLYRLRTRVLLLQDEVARREERYGWVSA